ncbi:MAG: alpha-mannosidase [Phycisphaerae bacterium]|nr:alpha-mannosidase [Phycisphaerae bacterium]
MARKRIHLICNAHLDPVWLWEWEEGAAAAIATFRTAADLIEEFPGFVFNHNEVILYRWVEEYEPALFKRIQKLVRQGRWRIMGGWYLQPDCNMPSGESFVRQILLGKSYFAEKFGVEPTTAINFDPFGHTRGLVQILAKSGYDSYTFCRPDGRDLDLPHHDFIWVGYDGSRILASRIIGFYNSQLGEMDVKIRDWQNDHTYPHFGLLAWGVGDHGGGPSRTDLRKIAKLMRDPKHAQLIHSNTEDYFKEVKAVRASLSEVHRDLNPWAVGCYTSQVRIKQRHRRLENELYATEKMSAIAAVQGLMAYPEQDLYDAACDLMVGEFHDILPGSAIQPVEEMSLRLMDHGLEKLSRIKARVFFALAQGQPKARPEEIPILVYNPHPYPVRTTVECEFQLPAVNWGEEYTLPTVYRDGKAVPSQPEKELSNLPIDWRKRIVFTTELAPSQMNRFDCRLSRLKQKPAPRLKASDGRIRFRTDDIEVMINTRTGLIDRYRARGDDYLRGRAFEPLVIRDNEDSWGMTTHSYRKVAGRFKLMPPNDGTWFSGVTQAVLPSVRVIEDGPVRSVVEAVFAWGRSFVCQRYKLPKEGTEIEVETRVHWNEKNLMLKLSIPTSSGEAEYLGQVAYGVGELPATGDEAVAQKWVAVVSRRDDQALTCINDGIYGSDYSSDGLRLTLLRSAAYSSHPLLERTILPQNRYSPRMEQGERLYRFWLNGGSVRQRLSAVDREALARNEKPFALSFNPPGLGRKPRPGVTLSDGVVQVTAIKKAQRGNDLIVRLFEPTGRARSTTLQVPFLGIRRKVELGKFEIKTLRINPRTRKVTEVNLLERPIR